MALGISPYVLGLGGLNGLNPTIPGGDSTPGTNKFGVNPDAPGGATNANGDNGAPQQNLPADQIPMYDTSLLGGHGDGCLHCTNASGGKLTLAQLQAAGQASMDKVIKHEQMHQAAAGGLAGAMTIKTVKIGPVTFAVGGSVPISIPGLDGNNPEKSRQQYQSVYNGAVAPGTDMSSADRGVASMASKMMFEADKLIREKQQREHLTRGLPGAADLADLTKVGATAPTQAGVGLTAG